MIKVFCLEKIMNLTFKDIMRAGHVYRWQIVRTLRKQSLAEHSFNVAMLSMGLAERIIPTGMQDGYRYSIYNWALKHDIPEIVTGDISTPVKNKIKSIAGGNIIEKLEKEIFLDFIKVKNNVDGKIKFIVKLADIIDAIVFLKEEGLGSHAKLVINKLYSHLDIIVDKAKIEYPKFEWEKAKIFCFEIVDGKDNILEFEYKL